jgi:hypothetical protein
MFYKSMVEILESEDNAEWERHLKCQSGDKILRDLSDILPNSKKQAAMWVQLFFLTTISHRHKIELFYHTSLLQEHQKGKLFQNFIIPFLPDWMKDTVLESRYTYATIDIPNYW